MQVRTGALSGSLCEAQIDGGTEESRSSGVSAGVVSAGNGFADAAARVAGAWIESIDDALGRARTQLHHEFEVWRRVSQLQSSVLDGPSVDESVGKALDVAMEVSGTCHAMVLRRTGADGALRVDHRRSAPDALASIVAGFAGANSQLLSDAPAIAVHDLGRPDAADPGDLLAPTLASAGIRTLVTVPLASTTGVSVGTMVLLSRSCADLSGRERRMLQMVARKLADLIDRGELESRAHRDSREMRAVLDSVSEAILTIDRDGLVRSANPACERIFGYVSDELLGTRASALVAPEARGRFADWSSSLLGTEPGAAFGPVVEVSACRKDGTPVQVEVVVSQVDPGALLCAVIRDVTERKVAESRLRQSDRLASLGTLAAGLGHDMSNVLFPIRAHLNALAEDMAEPGSAERRAHVNEIGEGVKYLQRLADGLHYLVHDAGHADGGMDGARLSQWWSATGSLLTRALPPLTEVCVDIGEHLPRVRASEHALTQAVLNLIVNAGEAMRSQGPDNRGHLRVTAHAAPDGSAINLAVVDDGPGMPESVRRRAFDMFFTTKTRGVGTGLGLAMVQRVASEAGGTAWIESAPGAGTTVTMRLPVAVDRSGAAGIAVAVSVADGRAAAFFESALAGRGFGVVQDPAQADAWIVDPRIVDAATADRWAGQRASRVLVLCGRPHRLNAPEWRGLAADAIEPSKDFDALLVGVDHTCSIIMGRSGNGRRSHDGAAGAGAGVGQEEGSQRRNRARAGRGARARRG